MHSPAVAQVDASDPPPPTAPPTTKAAEPPAPPAKAATAPVDQALGVRPVAEPVGQTLPRWLTVGGEYRARGEAIYGQGTIGDEFALNRLRFKVGVKFAPWAGAFVQFQDVRVFGFRATRPGSMENTADIREAYVTLGDPKRSPWGGRLGRQEISLGDQRLVTAGDWNNSARSFDGVRGTWTRKTSSFVALIAVPVATVSGGLDRWNDAERLIGALYTYRGTRPGTVVEPYVFVKTTSGATAGAPTSAIYTYGGRAAGPLGHGFDYNVEVALQRGHVKTETLMASAGHYGIGRTWTGFAWKPRLGMDVDVSSGDTDPKDGRRETFDSLYGSSHARFGLVDRTAWRNMRHAGLMVDAQPRKGIKLKATVRRLYVNELADGLYTSASGSPAAVVRPSGSGLIGDAVDLLATFELAHRISVGIGSGYLFAGPYTKVALKARDMWTPHVAWRVLF